MLVGLLDGADGGSDARVDVVTLVNNGVVFHSWAGDEDESFLLAKLCENTFETLMAVIKYFGYIS